MEYDFLKDPDYEIWMLLRRARATIMKCVQFELQPSGVSRAQLAILYAIFTTPGPVTTSDIARQLSREPHSVKAALDRMERLGLVYRARDLPKKNQLRVAMTPKGEAALDRSLASHRVIPDIISCLSHSERETLRSTLRKLQSQADITLRKLRFEQEFAGSKLETSDIEI